jgi:hypothetical protein
MDGDGRLCALRPSFNETGICKIEHTGGEKTVNVQRFGPPGTWAIVSPDYSGNYTDAKGEDLDLGLLIKHLKQSNFCLKELKIWFGTPVDISPRGLFDQLPTNVQVKDWHVDLSYLKQLETGLHRVKFVLGLHGAADTFQDPSYRHIFKEIRDQLEDAARHLVGATVDETCTIKDWTEYLNLDLHEIAYCYGDLEWHLEVTRNVQGASKGQITFSGLQSFSFSWRPEEVLDGLDRRYVLQ